MKELWLIDYLKEFESVNAISFADKVELITSDLSYLWSDIYRKNSATPSAIDRFPYGDFTFIFDDTGELIAKKEIHAEEVPEGRVVAAYGVSQLNPPKRNHSRMKGYLGLTSKAYAHYGDDYDKGHFIANATGGPMEINFFPQKRGINRGWTVEGKRYRAMEKFIAAHPGTFVFSRPWYIDKTLRPAGLEFGYISLNGEFVSDFFENL